MEMDHAQTIGILNKQLSKARSTIKELQDQVTDLKDQIHQKNIKIVQLNQRLNQYKQQSSKFSEQLRSRDIMLKNNNKALNTKNMQIQELQHKINNYAYEKQEEYVQKNRNLLIIISQQQQQINDLMFDYSQMLNSFQEVYNKQRYQYEEAQLLKQYNQQLTHQIQDVQKINLQLIKNTGQLEQQLGLQNDQSNDLLAHIQEMTETFQNLQIKA